MTIREAAKAGIARIRLDTWASKEDYLKLTILPGGLVGPWVKFYSPINEITGQENPQTIFCFDEKIEKITVFVKYDGKISTADEE